MSPKVTVQDVLEINHILSTMLEICVEAPHKSDEYYLGLITLLRARLDTTNHAIHIAAINAIMFFDGVTDREVRELPPSALSPIVQFAIVKLPKQLQVNVGVSGSC